MSTEVPTSGQDKKRRESILGVDLVPPHNESAEHAVLGGILWDNDAIHEVRDILQPEYFYFGRHRLIFETMWALINQGKPIDQVMLRETLEGQGLLEKAGGGGYFEELLQHALTSANIVFHARIIKEKAFLRKLIEVGQVMVSTGMQDAEPFVDQISQAEHQILEISQESVEKPFEPISKVMTATLEEIEKRDESDAQYMGLASGYYDLDQLTQGFQKGNLIIVAARPSMGKTALALNICANAALSMDKNPEEPPRHEDRPVIAVFSLEMTKTELAMRLLCAEGKVSAQRLRDAQAKISPAEWLQLNRAADRLHRTRMYIDDSSPLRPSDLRSKCHQILLEQKRIDLVIVDYLQLMTHDGRIDSREQQIASISRGLKSMAKDLKCPVMALSQLNREVEKRADKRPNLSDLRESGAIEQDADMVMFIHRDDYYHRETGLPMDDKSTSSGEGDVELIISKHRSGPTGSVHLQFLKDFTRFEQREFRGGGSEYPGYGGGPTTPEEPII